MSQPRQLPTHSTTEYSSRSLPIKFKSCLMDKQTVYVPLERHQIRLMVLPGKVKDPLSVRLVTTNLQADGIGAAATYEALSYQWGSPLPARNITVDDCPFRMRDNLYLALLALRDEQFPRCLWVDALCINQQDDMERGKQVSIMSQIFRQATKVLVWLGEAADDSDLLFELLAKVEGRLHLLDNLISIWGQAGVDITSLTRSRIQSAFLAISRRPYWTRLWIIQEILSASSIDLLCGSKTLAWASFSPGLESIGNLKFSPDSNICASTPAYAIAAKHSYQNQSYAIQDLVDLCCRCDSQCEDVRDKIYGLVSIAKDFDVVPDYTKTAKELCLDICRSLCGESRYDDPHYVHIADSGLGDLRFVNYQQLLGGPLWDHTEKCWDAMDDDLVEKLTRGESGLVTFDTTIKHLHTIVKIGPVISAGGEICEASVFQHETVLDKSGSPVTIHTVVGDIASFTPAAFHATAAICDLYTRKEAAGWYVKHANTPSIIEKSDGKVRSFWISSSLYGIASSLIREGDMLCYVHGIEKLSVIRPESQDSFTMIGRALSVWGWVPSSFSPQEVTTALNLPINCKLDMKTLLFLQR
ncbi:hypothetical protein VTL71DRAFT_16234 [Oculimacula yallundae]|uniref:Heterokaryon incompatibility domain-containing protein n=1 Tax=Oculimacula yallundae TaxID=86028 RepID=A0ABR4CF77_9HELO